MDKLNVLVKHMMASNLKPLLKQASFERYLSWGLEDRQGEREQFLTELFWEMDSALNVLPSGAKHRSELKEVYHFIQNETRKAEPNFPLLQASLYFLEREKELKSQVIQLRNIIYSGRVR
ncbi:hypothetical protein ACFQ5D_22395 [Paenibacillus farraposensis]|uniref:Uncharacterized protein n=1 Tax=Paenibacillus farraposensis TaxID=2807095 RepID=A0ABW4DJ36_9BACL|nr:hypothetical protein [Paenibacillus farraposensis]MCC3378513.1 hypothetical protein [Paenibacillus farraposensis]